MSDTRKADTWERFGLTRAERRHFERAGIREGDRQKAAWLQARRRAEREQRKRDWETSGHYWDNDGGER